MSDSDKKLPSSTARDAQSRRSRGSPLTDYHDASEPLHRGGGFEEPPQAGFPARL